MSLLKTQKAANVADPTDTIPITTPSPIQKKPANKYTSQPHLCTGSSNATMNDCSPFDERRRLEPTSYHIDGYDTAPQRLYRGQVSPSAPSARNQVLDRIEDCVPTYLNMLDALRQEEQENIKIRWILPSNCFEPPHAPRRRYRKPSSHSTYSLADRIRRHLVETLDPTSTLKTQRFFELYRNSSHPILHSVGPSSDNPIDLVSPDDGPTLKHKPLAATVDNPIILSDEEDGDREGKEVKITKSEGLHKGFR